MLLLLLLLRATTEAKAPPIRPSGTFPRKRKKGRTKHLFVLREKQKGRNAALPSSKSG